MDRPELKKLLAELQEGDTVIFKELTGVSRSTKDLLQIVEEITSKGCYIKSLSESWTDTESPTGEFKLTVFSGLVQMERRILLERTSEDHKMAIKRGVRMGRPKKNTDRLLYALELYDKKEMSICKICEVTNISKPTLYRRLAERTENIITGQVVKEVASL